jgi:hypothetical protein
LNLVLAFLIVSNGNFSILMRDSFEL